MRKWVLIAIAAHAAPVLAGAASTEAGQPAPHPSVSEMAVALSAAKKAKRPRYVRRAPQGQIACTVLGCSPVPRGCTPVTGYDWWGEPTGYDDIACR